MSKKFTKERHPKEIMEEDETKKEKRVTLERTISTMTSNEKIPMTKASFKSQSMRPWRLSRNKDSVPRDEENIVDDVDEEEDSGDFTMMKGDAPPVDTNMVLMDHMESFDDVNGEELRVKIVKDQLRLDLMELMRSHNGNVRVLEDMENGVVTPEHLEHIFKGCIKLEKNIGLLWAAFLKRKDYIEALLKSGADINYCEPNEGFSALHLSAFSGCVSSLKYLISKGANVNFALRNYTPLHSAAFGNSVATAKLLLDSGAHTDGVNTAIHSAIKANAVDCVQLLSKHCSDINSTEPMGKAAIHLAANLGHSQCLQAILDVEGVEVNVKTKPKQNTALHLAAESGNSENVTLLLAHNAEAEARNSRGQTALHLAAKAQSLECVETLLKAGCDPSAADLDRRTPLHCAVGRASMAFEVAEVLISWRADVNAKDKYGFTPLHIAALNELAQCVETLLYHGADVTARNKGGMTALGIIVRKTPASLAMIYNNLDRAISMHDPEDSNREVELKLDFRSILQHDGMGEISFLNTFVEEGQKEILEHPLCEAFLYLKWQKIRKYFIGRLIFCTLFVLSMTGYVMTALAHNCYNEGDKKTNLTNAVKRPVDINTRTWFAVETVDASNLTLCNSSVIGQFLRTHREIIEIEWYVLAVFTLLEAFRKFYGISGYATWRQYFCQLENLVEWFVIASVFAMSCIFTKETYSWQNHISAFAVLAAWSNLMFMYGQLPLLGTYVAMYTKVQKEFAKLLLAYICLIIGFTFSFCILFPNMAEFSNPLISFINVLVMMSGEVTMEFVGKGVEGSVQILNISAHFIYTIFLLLVTIVLMNLLVGIAVNDIQGLRKTAGLSKLVRQTQLINYIERAMFKKLLPRYIYKLLSLTALVSPSAYRVVLQVKPLNPREQRLPKEILQSAYELAKSLRPGGHTLSSRGSNLTSVYNSKRRMKSSFREKAMKTYRRSESEVDELKMEIEEGSFAVQKLNVQVKEMKDMLINNQILIQSLVDALQKK